MTGLRTMTATMVAEQDEDSACRDEGRRKGPDPDSFLTISRQAAYPCNGHTCKKKNHEQPTRDNRSSRPEADCAAGWPGSPL